MKILFVHNFYGSEAPSGENIVVNSEIQLLKKKGHEVLLFSKKSDDIRRLGFLGKIIGGISTPWSIGASKEFKKIIKNYQPEVIHVHNTFPLISPSIFYVIPKTIAVVITLHNYRLFCAAGIPMMDGCICTRCLDGHTVTPALKNRCYRHSLAATIPLTLNIALHRKIGTWQRKLNGFITLSDFQKNLICKAGLPSEKTFVKPNFYPGDPDIVDWDKRKDQAVFVGRLTEEKGVEDLLAAWELWGSEAPNLLVIGDGALYIKLKNLAENCLNGKIMFTGLIPSEKAHAYIANSKLVILPSHCFEGFPMVVREGFAYGTAVAVSDLGPLPSIVTHGFNGIVFKASNPQSLAETVSTAWNDEEYLKMLSFNAHKTFKEKYTEEKNYKLLMDIYKKAKEDTIRL